MARLKKKKQKIDIKYVCGEMMSEFAERSGSGFIYEKMSQKYVAHLLKLMYEKWDLTTNEIIALLAMVSHAVAIAQHYTDEHMKQPSKRKDVGYIA